MKPILPEEYDSVVDKWKQWQSFPWGRLLYRVSQSNIQRYLPVHKARILDVGGGNGWNSIYFAKLGHAVTLVDYSPVMMAEAKQAAEREGVIEQITFIQADAGKAAEIFEGIQFDFIICHLMIEFVQQPESVLQDICSLLAPGGYLSVLDANRYSEVYRKAFQANDLKAAFDFLGAREYCHPMFNRMTPLWSSQEVIDLLETAGCEPSGDYGVLCLCAYLPNEPKYDPEYYASLEKLELELTNQYPYPLLARFYQVIMKRPEEPK